LFVRILLDDRWIEEFLEIGQFLDGRENDIFGFEVAILFHLAYELLLVHDSVRVGVFTVLVSVVSLVVFVIPHIENNGNFLDNDSKYMEEGDPEENDGDSGDIIEEIVLGLEDD
jgi:hypothetical protein